MLTRDMPPLCEGHLSFIGFIRLYLPISAGVRRGGRNANFLSNTYVTTVPKVYGLELHQMFVKK
jgi:hypothetical protein